MRVFAFTASVEFVNEHSPSGWGKIRSGIVPTRQPRGLRVEAPSSMLPGSTADQAHAPQVPIQRFPIRRDAASSRGIEPPRRGQQPQQSGMSAILLACQTPGRPNHTQSGPRGRHRRRETVSPYTMYADQKLTLLG